MNICFYGGVNEIGGNKVLVEDNGTRVFLDFGRRMNEAGKYFEEYIKVRSKAALLDLLKLGVLPYVDGVYPDYLLDLSCFPCGVGVDIGSKLPLGDAGDYWKDAGVRAYDAENGVDGVFVSHAHFDHIQDVSFLHPEIPLVCSDVTKVIAKAVSDISPTAVDQQFYYIRDNVSLIEKERFFKTMFPGELDFSEDVEKQEVACEKSGYPVGHSVPGAVSVLLTMSDGKTVLYTGDIRFHGSHEPSLEEYVKGIGDTRVDVMICEGTRVDSPEKLTEEDIYQDIKKQVEGTKGLVLVDFGWKDTTRFDTIKRVAEETDRIFVISPKLAYLLFELHMLDPERFPDPREYENVRVYKKRQGNLLYAKHDYKKYKAGYLDSTGRNKAKADQNIVRICEKMGIGGDPAAEQGEVSSEEQEAFDLATHHIFNGVTAYEIRKNYDKYILMFSFWDANELFDLSLPSGEVTNAKYIRASCEPFNDEMEIDEEKLMNWLKKFEISFDSTKNEKGKEIFVRSHVSGHASQPELIELISKVNPKVFIPVHTLKPKIYTEIIPKINEDITVILPEAERTYTF